MWYVINYSLSSRDCHTSTARFRHLRINYKPMRNSLSTSVILVIKRISGFIPTCCVRKGLRTHVKTVPTISSGEHGTVNMGGAPTDPASKTATWVVVYKFLGKRAMLQHVTCPNLQ